MGQEPFIKAGCPKNNCIIVDDRNLISESHAVIFHAIDFDVKDMPNPQHRKFHQRFIFFNYESMVVYQDLNIFVSTANYFNWTMTYRRDSDIFDNMPYGGLKRRSDAFHPLDSFPVKSKPGRLPSHPDSMMQPWNISLIHRPTMAKKNKLIAWFVSHCQTDSLREEYFDRLSQFVPIDKYGKCGSLKCLPWNSPKCNKLLDNYKFYVAAENAICADYVTEKFYRALASNVVPIVYGGADYSVFAPVHSYIHVGDFKSPKALADYLRLLDENEVLYLRYFDWKKDYQVVAHLTNGWCDLCKKLNDPQQPTKVYKNLTAWWFHSNITCLAGYEFLESLL